MSSFVLDSSVTLAVMLKDEANERADLVWERLARDSAYVPGLWPYEVANALLAAERRRRISTRDVRSVVQELDNYPIHIVSQPAPRIFADAAVLAGRFGLSVYDAAYLDLALERQLPLATLDNRLASAAEAAGVELI